MTEDVYVRSLGKREAIERVKRLSPEIRENGAREIMRLSIGLRELARQKYTEAGLHVRTGALKSSIQALPVTQTEHELVGSVIAGQKLKYARVQEFGAVIRPKHARFLAIPLAAAKTGAGVARFSPRQAAAAGYESTFISKGVIFGRQGEQAVPLFVLKRSVRVPARPFMRPALAAMRPQIEAGIRAVVAAAAAQGAP